MKRRDADHGELLKGHTPTLILSVLAEAPCHGYAIAREIERRSRDALRLGEGSLYPALRALEADGWVTSGWEPRPAGPARRVYSITEAGRAELARRMERWRQFAQTIDEVLGGGAYAPEPA
jgi:PadR family transcriptional regulator PadR